MNSFLLVVPAVVISTLIGALNGYILTQFRFRGAHLLFAAMLFSVFIPFQIVLIPMAKPSSAARQPTSTSFLFTPWPAWPMPSVRSLQPDAPLMTVRGHA